MCGALNVLGLPPHQVVVELAFSHCQIPSNFACIYSNSRNLLIFFLFTFNSTDFFPWRQRDDVTGNLRIPKLKKRNGIIHSATTKNSTSMILPEKF